MTTQAESPVRVALPPSRFGALLTAWLMAVLMALTAYAAHQLRPTKFLSETRVPLEIGPTIPDRFGKWRRLNRDTQIVNPQSNALLQRLYSETISRFYESDDGETIMLSIAYGKRQDDGFEVHKPEVCYPAQGFRVISNESSILETTFGTIPVRRLHTIQGDARTEPITYWAMIGDHAVRSGSDKRIREIKYSMKGYIADGLLFRISSIDPNPTSAHEVHARFAADLLSAISPQQRLRIAGLQH